MDEARIEELKFPIGRFEAPGQMDDDLKQSCVEAIAAFPHAIKKIATGLTTNQLSQCYRPGSWSVKQVIHHCADSHMNAYTRFKLTASEHQPTIAPYDQDKWVLFDDANSDDLRATLLLLEGLHAKWSHFLDKLALQDLDRAYVHPEYGTTVALKEALPLYAWHCNHHLAQVKQAIRLNGNFA